MEVKTTCSELKINMPQPVRIEFDWRTVYFKLYGNCRVSKTITVQNDYVIVAITTLQRDNVVEVLMKTFILTVVRIAYEEKVNQLFYGATTSFQCILSIFEIRAHALSWNHCPLVVMQMVYIVMETRATCKQSCGSFHRKR